MIKTVIFDLGGVIVPFSLAPALTAIEELSGHGIEEIRRRLRSSDVVTRFEAGKIESEPFIAELCSLLEFQATSEEFATLWNSIFSRGSIVSESLLSRIKAKHRLLALSNTNPIHYDWIARSYPMLRLFDYQILSYRTGAVKPDPNIYAAALAEAHCRPEECFFTDDVLAYVEGARKAGMDAVQFISEPQLEQELRLRGVL